MIPVGGGIVDSVISGEPTVPLVNSPKIEQSIIPEVKHIEPVIVPQEQKVVPVAPVAPVVADYVVPVVVVPEVPVAAPAVVVPVVEEHPVPVVVEEVKAEKNSQDPHIVLTEPIDKATKLVIELDEHIRKYFPSEDEVPTTSSPAVYAPGDVVAGEDEPSNTVTRQNQMTALIDQVNRLIESIEVRKRKSFIWRTFVIIMHLFFQNTITDLVARRRYVTAAMLRSMLNYVRRVRVNLERLQNRLQSVQAVATSGQNAPQGAGGASGIPGTAFFNTIRDRVNRITEEIGALVTRIRGSFTPGSNVVTASPLPPLATAANIAADVAQASASASIASAVGTIVAAGTGIQNQVASVVSSVA